MDKPQTTVVVHIWHGVVEIAYSTDTNIQVYVVDQDKNAEQEFSLDAPVVEMIVEPEVSIEEDPEAWIKFQEREERAVW